jgi:hypothetical protein
MKKYILAVAILSLSGEAFSAQTPGPIYHGGSGINDLGAAHYITGFSGSFLAQPYGEPTNPANGGYPSSVSIYVWLGTGTPPSDFTADGWEIAYSTGNDSYISANGINQFRVSFNSSTANDSTPIEYIGVYCYPSCNTLWEFTISGY